MHQNRIKEKSPLVVYLSRNLENTLVVLCQLVLMVKVSFSIKKKKSNQRIQKKAEQKKPVEKDTAHNNLQWIIKEGEFSLKKNIPDEKRKSPLRTQLPIKLAAEKQTNLRWKILGRITDADEDDPISAIYLLPIQNKKLFFYANTKSGQNY